MYNLQQLQQYLTNSEVLTITLGGPTFNSSEVVLVAIVIMNLLSSGRFKGLKSYFIKPTQNLIL